MGKPPGLSEGPYVSPNVDHDEDMAAHGANPRIAKWVYIAVVITIVVLGLAIGIGLHIPNGE